MPRKPFGTGANNVNSLPFAKGLPGSNRFLKLGWTRVFSGNVVNDARFGFSRFFFAQDPSEPIQLSDIGATRGNSAQFPAAYQLIITGALPLVIGTGVNDNRGGAFNTFYGGDDLSITKGKHLLRFGMDASRYQLNRFNNFAQRGSVTFSNTAAGDASPGFPNPPALSGFQNFLLGRVDTTQAEAGFSSFHFRALDFSAYVQDDWKIKPRFTLNLGLRWEGLSTAHELNNFLSNFRGLEDGQPGPISIIHPSGAANVGTAGVSSCTLTTCFSAGNFAPPRQLCLGHIWQSEDRNSLRIRHLLSARLEPVAAADRWRFAVLRSHQRAEIFCDASKPVPEHHGQIPHFPFRLIRWCPHSLALTERRARPFSGAQAEGRFRASSSSPFGVSSTLCATMEL